MSHTLSRADMILEKDRELAKGHTLGSNKPNKSSRSQNARAKGALRDAMRTANIIKQLCNLTNDYHKKLGGNGKRVSVDKASEPVTDVIDFIQAMS